MLGGVGKPLRVKIDIDQVLPLGAGQGTLEDCQILFRFFLTHAPQGTGERGNHFPLVIYITAPDAGDVVVLQVKAALDFTNIFFVHFFFSSLFQISG